MFNFYYQTIVPQVDIESLQYSYPSVETLHQELMMISLINSHRTHVC